MAGCCMLLLLQCQLCLYIQDLLRCCIVWGGRAKEGGTGVAGSPPTPRLHFDIERSESQAGRPVCFHPRRGEGRRPFRSPEQQFLHQRTHTFDPLVTARPVPLCRRNLSRTFNRLTPSGFFPIVFFSHHVPASAEWLGN